MIFYYLVIYGLHFYTTLRLPNDATFLLQKCNVLVGLFIVFPCLPNDINATFPYPLKNNFYMCYLLHEKHILSMLYPAPRTYHISTGKRKVWYLKCVQKEITLHCFAFSTIYVMYFLCLICIFYWSYKRKKLELKIKSKST